MNEIAAAIKEVVALFRELLDPEKRKGLLEVKKLRDMQKALNVAEEIFIVVDMMRAYPATSGDYKHYEDKYIKLKKKFNKYD